MSSFQDVRGAMAKLTSKALEAAKVTLANQAFDNTLETPPKDAAGTYAVVSISFPSTVIEDIGCEGVEHIIGSCNVVLYTPKRAGMLPAETIMQAVIKEWVRVNKALVNEGGVHLKTRNLSGPNALGGGTIDEARRPHQVTQLSCAFTARPA
jgi:hypothetical protein